MIPIEALKYVLVRVAIAASLVALGFTAGRLCC
jgi:hypothetical protein